MLGGMGRGFGRMGGHSGGLARGTGWTPTRLGSKLAAWWNADDHGTARMTDAGAGLITNWVDNTTNAIAVGAASTARPTWSADGFDTGKAGVTFDGVANTMIGLTLTGLPAGAAPGELWVLINETSGDANGRVVIAYGDNSIATYRRIQKSATALYAILDGTTVLSDTAVASAGKHIVGGIFGATIYEGRIDGRSFSPPSVSGATLNTSTTRLRIGASSATSPGVFFKGAVRQIVIPSLLTPNERLQLEGWMAWDAGLPTLLPAGHPFRLEAP